MLVLLVNLWLREGAAVAGFEAFERTAQELMAPFGGRVERCWRPAQTSGEAAVPFEVQLVSFPGRAELAAYLADAGVQARAAQRDQLIAKTVVWEAPAVDYLDIGGAATTSASVRIATTAANPDP